MSKFLFGTTIALSLIAISAPALAATVCLSTRDMKQTKPKDDGSAITFTMRDGSVWRNDLRGRCPTMRWNGFGYSTSNPQASICENEQTLVDFRTGETCGLGNFTQVAPARMDHQASR